MSDVHGLQAILRQATTDMAHTQAMYDDLMVTSQVAAVLATVVCDVVDTIQPTSRTSAKVLPFPSKMAAAFHHGTKWKSIVALEPPQEYAHLIACEMDMEVLKTQLDTLKGRGFIRELILQYIYIYIAKYRWQSTAVFQTKTAAKQRIKDWLNDFQAKYNRDPTLTDKAQVLKHKPVKDLYVAFKQAEDDHARLKQDTATAKAAYDLKVAEVETLQGSGNMRQFPHHTLVAHLRTALDDAQAKVDALQSRLKTPPSIQEPHSSNYPSVQELRPQPLQGDVDGSGLGAAVQRAKAAIEAGKVAWNQGDKAGCNVILLSACHAIAPTNVPGGDVVALAVAEAATVVPAKGAVVLRKALDAFVAGHPNADSAVAAHQLATTPPVQAKAQRNTNTLATGSDGSANSTKVANEYKQKLKVVESKWKADRVKLNQLEQALTKANNAGGKGGSDGGDAVSDRVWTKKLADAEKKAQKVVDDLQTQSTRQITALRTELVQASATVSDLTNQVQELTTTVAALRTQTARLSQLEKDMVGLQAEAATAATLTTNLNTLTQQYATLESQYKEEQALRKKYYNTIEDMKGKIRVYCRCRPMSSSELDRNCHSCVRFLDDFTLEVDTARGPRSFTYDAVFNPSHTQDHVFEDTKHLLQSALDGYNVCIFAYGQTGSGKTFTMTGGGTDSHPGITKRLIELMFALQESQASNQSISYEASMLELYNDQLIDLLAQLDPAYKEDKALKLDIKKNEKGMVVVTNAASKACTSAHQTLRMFDDMKYLLCRVAANKKRQVGSTKMNAESSRSHSVFTVLIHNYNKTTKQLTQLMQDSLGGNAKTLMFVNISPADYNQEETQTSLSYASRVKLITNQANKTSDSEEVAKLKAIIKQLKAGSVVDDDVAASEGDSASFVLFESASGYALFEVVESEQIAVLLDQVQQGVQDLGKFGAAVKLKAFSPFVSAESALENINAISEGLVTDDLQAFLELNLPKAKKSKSAAVTLGVSDKGLAQSITDALHLSVNTNETTLEVLRGVRLHFAKFIKELDHGVWSKAQLGLGHSYSRAKVKFNVNRADNMIIQAIALLDQLDKDINTFAMRVREWYSWHFPELLKIVPDNYVYARCAAFIQHRTSLSEESVEELSKLTMDEDKAAAIVAASRTSMGMDMSELDMLNVANFTSRLIGLAEYRQQLHAYLHSKMGQVAP
ncbi:hypothetical protein AaE_010727, partial [Aphanomyces astaci]